MTTTGNLIAIYARLTEPEWAEWPADDEPVVLIRDMWGCHELY
jgi:hypothetical protein